MTNWACHGKHEKNRVGRVSQRLVHTQITPRKLNSIKNTLSIVVGFLARQYSIVQLYPQSEDVSEGITVQSREEHAESPSVNDESVRDFLDDLFFGQFEEEWGEPDFADLKWYKRAWYWIRTCVCYR
jgi:hypothetical protein